MITKKHSAEKTVRDIRRGNRRHNLWERKQGFPKIEVATPGLQSRQQALD